MTSDEQWSKFLRLVFAQAKALDTEIRVRQFAIKAIEVYQPELTPLIDKALLVAREDPELQRALHQKYDEALEQFLQQHADEVNLEAALKAFESMPVN